MPGKCVSASNCLLCVCLSASCLAAGSIPSSGAERGRGRQEGTVGSELLLAHVGHDGHVRTEPEVLSHGRSRAVRLKADPWDCPPGLHCSSNSGGKGGLATTSRHWASSESTSDPVAVARLVRRGVNASEPASEIQGAHPLLDIWGVAASRALTVLPLPHKTESRLRNAWNEFEVWMQSWLVKLDPRRSRFVFLSEVAVVIVLVVATCRCCLGRAVQGNSTFIGNSREEDMEGSTAPNQEEESAHPNQEAESAHPNQEEESAHPNQEEESAPPNQEEESAAPNQQEESAPPSPEDEEMRRLKKLKHKLLMDQAVNKSRLEKTIQEIAALQEVVDAAGQPAMTAELAKRQAEEAMRAHELMAERSLVSAIAYVAPFAMQGKRIAAALDSGLQRAREKTFDLVAEEVKSLGSDLYRVLDVDDFGLFRFSQFGEIDLPALALLIASAFAPTQLKALHQHNFIAFAIKLVVLILNGVIIVTDRNEPCASGGWGASLPNDVLLWYKVDFFVALVCFLVRVSTWRVVGAVLKDIDRPPPYTPESPIEAARVLVEYYVTTGGEALIHLERVLRDRLYNLVGWAMLFDFLWAIVGIDLVLNIPYELCPHLSIAILRARSIFFLIVFIPFLVALILWGLTKFLESEFVFMRLFNLANALDRSLALGFPLAKLLLQVWYIRNTADILKLELKVMRMDEDVLLREQAKHQREMDSLKAAQEKLQANMNEIQEQIREAAQAGTESSLEREHEQAKERILQESEKFFFHVNTQSKKAADEASKQVDAWKAGEGPEALAALAKGDGVTIAQQYLGELQESVRKSTESGMAAASELAGSEQVAGLQAQIGTMASDIGEQGMEALRQAGLSETSQQGESLSQSATSAAREPQAVGPQPSAGTAARTLPSGEKVASASPGQGAAGGSQAVPSSTKASKAPSKAASKAAGEAAGSGGGTSSAT